MKAKRFLILVALSALLPIVSVAQDMESTVCVKCDGQGTVACRKYRSCPACSGCGAVYNYAYGRNFTCGACAGKGTLPCFTCMGKGYKTCPECRGTKHRRITENDIAGTGFVICGRCNGRGHSMNVACRTCMGFGIVPEDDKDGSRANPSSEYQPSQRTDDGDYQRVPRSGRSMHGKSECPSCNYTGKCDYCGGKGRTKVEVNLDYYVNDCPICNGTGKCKTCHGKGYIPY